MSKCFLQIVNMSISASWIVLAILLFRFIFKKAPKWIFVLLWGIVAVRLICPFSIESPLSLVPDANLINTYISIENAHENNTDAAINEGGIENGIGIAPKEEAGIETAPIIDAPTVTPALTKGQDTTKSLFSILSGIWIFGMVLLLAYTVISYQRVKRKVGTAVLLRDNIYQSENVISPFILGIIKPKIYLPFSVKEQDIGHIIAHEQAHIKRKDHWWKPLGFLLLAIHWFNPLMWLGYVLLCRDIELACDEKVVRELNNEQRTDYSQALLTCSVNRRMIAACPLAFGAVGVKTRVKSVLNYKKPAFWIIAVAVTVSVILAVCFLTNPISKKLIDIENLSLDSITESTVYVLVSDGEIYSPVGVVGEDLLQNLSNIKISCREVSNNRSEDRDISHTLVLQNEQDTEATISSYFLNGTYIHFNSDFTSVWVNTGVKPTLSYKVINPHEAKKIYNRICKYIDVTADDSSTSEIPYTEWYHIDKVPINYNPDITLYEEDFGLTSDVDVTNEHYKAMTKVDIENLREKFPMYFYLPASNGLEIYIWQMAKGSFSCGLLPANNQNYTQEELWNLTPASIVEMRAIVFCYLSSGIDQNDIAICPIQNPISSYAYNIDDDYREKITKLFWSSGFPPMDLTSISPTIDTAIFDIDGDGKDETCTLNYGPTSGLFTFTLAGYQKGELEYFNIFNSPCLDLSFTKNADGKTILCGKDGNQTRYMDIDVDNENIVISCAKEDITYWGEQGLNSPYAATLMPYN